MTQTSVGYGELSESILSAAHKGNYQYADGLLELYRLHAFEVLVELDIARRTDSRCELTPGFYAMLRGLAPELGEMEKYGTKLGAVTYETIEQAIYNAEIAQEKSLIDPRETPLLAGYVIGIADGRSF